jgi:hypothetical protein
MERTWHSKRDEMMGMIEGGALRGLDERNNKAL